MGFTHSRYQLHVRWSSQARNYLHCATPPFTPQISEVEVNYLIYHYKY